MAKAIQKIEKAKVGRPKGPSKDFAEIGHTGLRHSQGQIREEFLASLIGPKGVRIFKEMKENDPVVAAMLFAVERVIMQAHWEVVAGGNDQKDIDAANFIVSCMNDMSHTWEDFMTEIISMLVYGWSAFEIVYKVRKNKNNPKLDDRRIGWRKFGFRGQDTLNKWELDEQGGIHGMWQSTQPSYKNTLIPMEKMLLFRTKSEKNNPEGKSVLRGAYRSWFFKKTIEEIEAIGIERDLVGLPILTPPEEFDLDDPENTEVKTWAQNVITSIRRDEQEGVLLPPGWKLELQGSPGKRQFDTDVIINRYNRLIAMTMLAQFLMLGMDKGAGGSYSLSENQSDLFMLSIIGWMNSITEVINRFAVTRLIELNPEFAGLENPPKVQPVRVTPPDLTELSNYIFKLTRVGMMAPDEELVSSLRSMALLLESPQSREIKMKKPGEAESIMANIMAQQEANMKPAGAAGEKKTSTAGGAAKKPAKKTTKEKRAETKERLARLEAKIAEDKEHGIDNDTE